MTTMTAGAATPSALEQAVDSLEFDSFRPKRTIDATVGRYRIKTAQSPAEVLAALRLRHEVFFRERLGRTLPGEIDFDRFDLFADHLIVIDTEANRLIATYRMLCSNLTKRFYSETEFELDGFLAANGAKLELGRACIASDYRNGTALNLVWKGVLRYAAATGARFLFGCTSVDTVDLEIARGILDCLGHARIDRRYGVQPKPRYRFDWDGRAIRRRESGYYEAMIPSLLKSYLKAGARVHGFPALDRAFQSTDFFTVLDFRDMTPRFAARFMKEAA